MEILPRSSAAGFVLAGGRSSRMGADKALALFNGVPLVQVALQTLASAGIAARIAGSRSALATYAEEIPDTFHDRGPLAGVHAALSASAAEWNLFLPVDLPLMPPSLLACLLQRAMLSGAPVTATRLNGRIQPFPAVICRNLIPYVVRRIETGETACYQAWQTVPQEIGMELDAPPVEHLVQCGHCRNSLDLPPVLWFQSANTPDELASLSRIGTELRPPTRPGAPSALRSVLPTSTSQVI